MFNPHIHQQQQQQFHQQLRQLQQLFQQQQPPPPPPQPPPGHHVAHHHQTPRTIPVAPQTAPPPRMVNLSHASQTTIIAPNPMLQGALLMQQMQGNMRGFGMGGQQFRQFFTAGNRSSLLGPVPMGMAIKSPIMGFPATRPFHPHPRYFNNNNNTTTSSASSASSSSSSADAANRQPDRKRDSEQMAAGSSDEQPAAASSTTGANGKTQADGATGGLDGPTQLSEEQLEEPAVKKKRTEWLEKPTEQGAAEAVTTANIDAEALSSECSNNTEDVHPEECIALEESGSRTGSDIVDALEETKVGELHSCSSAPSPSGRPSEGDRQANLPAEETSQSKDAPVALPESQDEEEEGVAEGSSKFYCYLCSTTCHNQQNFRSHMNSISHQQRMMEIQHMSNACLVTLLPRVQESLQGANKDGEKKDLKRWCATCLTHFTSSIADHRRTEEHKLASKTDMSSCAICKKHFKNSQMFLEHLQSQEHRQKLQETDCEAFAKLASLGTEGFSLETEEGTEEEKGLSNQGDGEDGWSSLKEATDVSSDEQYDPDTVYGSSFLVPVAGFICKLCNKFYNFESSALHGHCKSLQHFENLKRYKALVSRKGEDAEDSRESVQPADGLMHINETASDCSDKNLLSDDTDLATNLKSLQPVVTLTQLKMQIQGEEKGKLAEPEATSEDLSTTSATITSNMDTSPAEVPASSSVDMDSEPSASAEDATEELEEREAPATQGKKIGTGKAPRRRSGRAANRR
ncbi:cdkn1a interacting zinc finger protein 1a [Astatotilapia calliptera]|uniref:Matrin-type domain-containing protein n=1 Tax=Astatotilapia calliptera TaxID=8154 RepID=A0A3P8PHV7_ASTCA|nr:cip1-interacting zinc finger protein-like [Astatotilapia calliptera]